MKQLILIAVSFMVAGLSTPASAMVECGGKATDGSFVTLKVTTKGPMGIAEEGEVTIENGGNKYGYRFNRTNIAQFFEYDEPSDNSAVVGLGAYVNQENPVSIKYVGDNYVDMDLKAAIQGGATFATGNFLRIWKGPGRGATDQYQLTKFLCSVWPNN